MEAKITVVEYSTASMQSLLLNVDTFPAQARLSLCAYASTVAQTSVLFSTSLVLCTRYKQTLTKCHCKWVTATTWAAALPSHHLCAMLMTAE